MNLFDDLRDRGLWSGYSKFVVGLEPVLEDISRRGIPVSIQAHAALSAQLTRELSELESAMQALVPDEVKPFSPPKGYVKIPKELSSPPTNPRLGLRASASPTNPGAESLTPSQPGVCAGIAGRADVNGVCEVVIPTFLLRMFPDGPRWVKLKKWTPSTKGLIRYMKAKGHPVPKHFKTGNETTTDDELKKLGKDTRDPLYEMVREYRNTQGTLKNHMKNWAPDAEGRVHPTFYYDTGTGQLASRRPNAQNAPRHGEGSKLERATAFRSMIAAKPGHTLLEFDYKSFHAQTLAFEANDADYLRLAKLDIHAYLTAHLVRHPDRDRLIGFGDEELADRLRAIRAAHEVIRDTKAKRTVLSYGFGIGYRKLYQVNREIFTNQRDAKNVIDTMNGLFPRAAKWREAIKRQAHEQGHLLSRDGCIRYFWEVFRWSAGQLQQGGDDAEAAIAFLPANDAFCHIKKAMLRLDAAGWLTRAGCINQIHDSLMFECPDSDLDAAIPAIRAEMERPSDTLIGPVAPTGLAVEVSVNRGKIWSAMRKVSSVPSPLACAVAMPDVLPVP